MSQIKDENLQEPLNPTQLPYHNQKTESELRIEPRVSHSQNQTSQQSPQLLNQTDQPCSEILKKNSQNLPEGKVAHLEGQKKEDLNGNNLGQVIDLVGFEPELKSKKNVFQSETNKGSIIENRLQKRNKQRNFQAKRKNFRRQNSVNRSSVERTDFSVADTLLNGVIAQSELYSFEWKDVSLTAIQGGKAIIKNCYGAAKLGEIVVIIGPHKSGKSSLLKLLAQKIPIFVGRKQGKYSINNCKFKPAYLSAHSVFVRGEDLFHDVFTAKELLDFSARLRVKGPKSHRKNVIESILRDYELEANQDIIIQKYQKHDIPNIEKRKISIALEMLDEPDIVFIDDIIGGNKNGGISDDRVGQFGLLSMVKKEAK